MTLGDTRPPPCKGAAPPLLEQCCSHGMGPTHACLSSPRACQPAGLPCRSCHDVCESRFAAADSWLPQLHLGLTSLGRHLLRQRWLATGIACWPQHHLPRCKQLLRQMHMNSSATTNRRCMDPCATLPVYCGSLLATDGKPEGPAYCYMQPPTCCGPSPALLKAPVTPLPRLQGKCLEPLHAAPQLASACCHWQLSPGVKAGAPTAPHPAGLLWKGAMPPHGPHLCYWSGWTMLAQLT